jgi:hypothetical protein
MLLHSNERLSVFEDSGADLSLIAIRYSGNLEMATTDLIITGRPLADYQSSRVVGQDLTQYMGKHVIEVGAGMGGLIPALAAIQSPGDPRPTVIDPSPYPAISGLLQEAVDSGLLNPQQSALAQEWRGRVEVILDPAKVDLINTTFEQAMATMPDLKGSADYCVDLFGPIIYSSLGIETIKSMEHALLR